MQRTRTRSLRRFTPDSLSGSKSSSNQLERRTLAAAVFYQTALSSIGARARRPNDPFKTWIWGPTGASDSIHDELNFMGAGQQIADAGVNTNMIYVANPRLSNPAALEAGSYSVSALATHVFTTTGTGAIPTFGFATQTQSIGGGQYRLAENPFGPPSPTGARSLNEVVHVSTQGVTVADTSSSNWTVRSSTLGLLTGAQTYRGARAPAVTQTAGVTFTPLAGGTPINLSSGQTFFYDHNLAQVGGAPIPVRTTVVVTSITPQEVVISASTPFLTGLPATPGGITWNYNFTSDHTATIGNFTVPADQASSGFSYTATLA